MVSCWKEVLRYLIGKQCCPLIAQWQALQPWLSTFGKASTGQSVHRTFLGTTAAAAATINATGSWQQLTQLALRSIFNLLGLLGRTTFARRDGCTTTPAWLLRGNCACVRRINQPGRGKQKQATPRCVWYIFIPSRPTVTGRRVQLLSGWEASGKKTGAAPAIAGACQAGLMMPNCSRHWASAA
jgi:hypothetical protein